MRAWALLYLVALPLAAQKQHELCAVCHSETVQDFRTHRHFQKGLECAVCHGDSVAHRTSQGHTEPDRVPRPHDTPDLCGACHTGQGPTPVARLYAASKHGRLVMEQSKVRAPHCGTCHGVHSLRQGRATDNQCRRCHATLPAGHPKTAAGDLCAACHDPHTLIAKRR
jgi:hypothetical protein